MTKIILYLKRKPTPIYLLILLVLCLYLMRYFFEYPLFPQAADAEYHLGRIPNYLRALQGGQFPVRWAPSLNYHLGYPIFLYHYPLPFIVGAGLHWMGLTVSDAFKLIVITSYISSAIGTFFWLRLYFKREISFLASIVLVTSPYFLNLIYGRASIGEIVALGIFPWLGLVCWKYVTHPNRHLFILTCLSMSLFLLSHNLSAIFGSVTLGLWLVVAHKQKALYLLTPAFVAALLSLWFWLPATIEVSYTHASSTELITGYYKHFLDFWEVWNIPPDLSYGTEFLQEPMKLQVGYGQLVVLLISIFYLATGKLSRTMGYWLGVSVFCVGMLFSYSDILWKIIPMVEYFQFPLRLLWYFSFSITWLAAWMFSQKGMKVATTMAIVLALFNTLFLYPPKYFIYLNDEYLYQYPLTTTAANEFNPIWYQEIEAGNFAGNHFAQLPIEAFPTATIHEEKISDFEIRYQVSTQEPVDIVEKGLYFPGWETRVNGEKIEWSIPQIEKYYGLRSFRLEPGEFTVETKWTENTWTRQVGNSLSLIGLVALVATYWYFDHVHLFLADYLRLKSTQK